MFKSGVKKYFWVSCLISLILFSGNGIFISPVALADDDGTVPQVPTAVTPTDGVTVPGTSTTYILQWAASEGATTYRLEVNSSPSWDETTRFFYEEVGNVTSKEISGLPYNETTYYWRVWAGSDSGWSDPSDSGSFTTPSWLESESVDLVTNNEGRTLARISVSGQPASNSVVSSASSSPEITSESTSCANIISNVPAFDWSYGSSPTAAAMLFGYYDRNGYPDMYIGPANKGVCPLNNEAAWSSGECPLSATHQNYNGLTTNGHVDDYYATEKSFEDPYWDSVNNTQLWAPHTDADCTADFMGTSQYMKWSNRDGATTFFFDMSGDPLLDYTSREPANRDGCHGMLLFAESRGYTVTGNYNQLIYPNPLLGTITHGFTFDDYKAEIKEGRPVLLHIGDYTTLGIGYNDPDILFMHDTLSHSVHLMTWGGTYMDNPHYGVSVIELSPLCIPPATPLLLSPEDGATIAGKSITFEWNASPGAILFRIQVKRARGLSLFKSVTVRSTSYTMSGFPEDGADYVWRVRAYYANGWSDYSPLRSFTNAFNPSATSPPPVPTLSLPANGASVPGKTITFKWSASPGAIKYRIQVKRASGLSLFKSVTVRSTTYTMSGFPANGTDYIWRVRAYNANGWSDYSPLRSFTNTFNTSSVSSPRPPVPTLTSPADGATVAGNSITFEWNASIGATKYLLLVNTSPTWDIATRKFYGNVGNTTTFTNIGYPDDGTVYYWKVWAGNDVGWSPPSDTWNFTNGS